MDITEIILAQHNEQRRLFGFIQQMHGADRHQLEAVWKRLEGFLEAHAEGEEKVFYPRLLKEGSGAADAKSAEAETKDAIKDHNDIRDAAGAVGKEEVGSDAWFKAVAKADVKNSEHMSEEERQALADFRCAASLEERHRLGVEFLAFVSNHLMGVQPVDKNPEAYVENPQREMQKAGS